jgi:hypothetical protein
MVASVEQWAQHFVSCGEYKSVVVVVVVVVV